MRYLTEQHRQVAMAKARREAAVQAVAQAGVDEIDAAEAELISAARAVREARNISEEYECAVCGPVELGEHLIYHIDQITEHHADGSTTHTEVNLHRLECKGCKSQSKAYHAKR